MSPVQRTCDVIIEGVYSSGFSVNILIVEAFLNKEICGSAEQNLP